MGDKKLFDKLTVIIPTLNEVDTIGAVMGEVFTRCPEAEILVADDNSRDGTIEIVNSIIQKGHPVRILVRKGKIKGLTASILDALELVERPNIAVIDGDLQHPPSKIPELVSKLDGADVVVGVRKSVAGNWSYHRRMISKLGDILARFRLSLRGVECSDPLSGFFAIRTDLMKDIVNKQRWRFPGKGFKVLFNLLKCIPKGTRTAEIFYTFDLRKGGDSKLGNLQLLAFVRSLLT